MSKLKSGSTKNNSMKSSTIPSYRGSTDVAGSKFMLPLNYGGMGIVFYDQLSKETDKILQVDTINNITETKGSAKARGVQLAVEMQARGIGRNDIILISSKSHAHQTIVLLATLFLGAIECLQLVKKLKPKMCFCDSRTISQIDRILSTLNITSEIVNFGSEVSGTTQFCKLFPLRDNNDFKPISIDNPDQEVAFIIPTQGTCADPKLVCLSHHNIYMQCFNFMELFENPSKIISFFPLSWITETVFACASLEYGVTRILSPTFNERIACKMIHDFLIDVAVLGTDLAMRLTGNVAIKDYNLNCLKCVLVGVVNTSKEDMLHMRRVLPNVKFLQVYTITETGCIAAVPSSNYAAALEKPSSVGKLLKNCKIKIIDIETKQPVGPDKYGELYFHGDGLMLGYFKDNSGTMAAIEKGYFKTGDLAKYDEEGWLYLQGRIDDMIRIGDLKFAPLQIEDCIVSHPHVHDAVIIGNHHEVVACIQKKPESKLTPDNLMMFISKKMPDYHKTFTRIIFFDELPRTSAGNVKKRVLRDDILKVQIHYTKSLASIGPSVTE